MAPRERKVTTPYSSSLEWVDKWGQMERGKQRDAVPFCSRVLQELFEVATAHKLPDEELLPWSVQICGFNRNYLQGLLRFFPVADTRHLVTGIGSSSSSYQTTGRLGHYLVLYYAAGKKIGISFSRMRFSLNLALNFVKSSPVLSPVFSVPPRILLKACTQIISWKVTPLLWFNPIFSPKVWSYPYSLPNIHDFSAIITSESCCFVHFLAKKIDE